MSARVSFELCAETLAACRAARDGGADRIELCSALKEDGLTPSHALINAAVKQNGPPVHALMRPRGGGFSYSESEMALLREDVLHARALGVSGVVIGILRLDGTIDVDRTSELVALAAPLEVTFHRAFDLASDRNNALEAVIATGCHRLLTSGGQRTALEGATTLELLVKAAGTRIEIVAGGGVRADNVAEIVKRSGVRHVHSSLRKKAEEAAGLFSAPDSTDVVEVADVREMTRSIDLL